MKAPHCPTEALAQNPETTRPFYYHLSLLHISGLINHTHSPGNRFDLDYHEISKQSTQKSKIDAP